MKEFKTVGEIIQQHYPIPKKYPRKRWVISLTRRTDKAQATQNSCVEAAYHRIIEAVKTLYLKSDEMYYECDMKHDKPECFLAMHSFTTPTFHCYLECDFCYEYRVEYAFNNCPFEADIRSMLIPYPLDRQSTEVKLEPTFESYYDNVIRIQDPAFIHSFKR